MLVFIAKLQNESIRITNRIDSNRELECCSGDPLSADGATASPVPVPTPDPQQPEAMPAT